MSRLIDKSDKRVTQTLASGMIIRQDFRTSVRFVFFDTGDPNWQYATHGGTLFVVNYRGQPYGLTCRHVLQDFNWRQLVVTDERHGSKIAGLSSVSYPSQPKGAAVETDLLDIAVIQFSSDIGADFFGGGAPYIVDDRTVVTSKVGDTLHVSGALKEKSAITDDSIAPVFCLLELQDAPQNASDPTLRLSVGKFEKPEFSGVQGLSGSPVFNVTQGGLCGLVVRGALNSDVCSLWYIDMFDIIQLLKAVHENKTDTYYTKQVVKVASER